MLAQNDESFPFVFIGLHSNKSNLIKFMNTIAQVSDLNENCWRKKNSITKTITKEMKREMCEIEKMLKCAVTWVS